MQKHLFALLCIALLGLCSTLSTAQMVEGESLDDPATEAKAFDIAKRTMSPFCPGRTLADCPSGKATEWRQDIRAFLKQGKSAAEIQKILNARAGENLTGTPESSLGWLLPVGLCVGALGVLTLVVSRIRREDAPTESGPGPRHVANDEDDDEDDDEDAPQSDAAAAALKARDQELEERLRRELEDQDDA